LHLVEFSALGPGRKKQLPAESNGSITLDNKWYGMVWQLQEMWALQVEFSQSILPIA